MRSVFFALVLAFPSTAFAEDIPAYLVDEHLLDTAAQRTALATLIKVHFGDTINLSAAQQVYCSRAPQSEGIKADTCRMIEEGLCTRRQYSNAVRAGLHVIPIKKINADTIHYRRIWDKELVDDKWVLIKVTDGARQDALEAYLAERHKNKATWDLLLDLMITRRPDSTPGEPSDDPINSKAVYMAVIDDLDIADRQLDKTLHGLAPNEAE